MIEVKPIINYEEFSKIDIRVGTILSAEKIEKSEKLIRMEVDFGLLGKRQILAGIKMWYKPGDLINKQLPFVINIEPRKMMGLESQGMILAADSNDKAVILLPDSSIENGTSIR